METPIAIANFFINKANSIGESITPMKLLKLVYLAHGWYLGLNNGNQLIPEYAQAWKYGPVIQSVYEEFKEYKGSQITRLGTLFNSYPTVQNQELIPFLDKIWDVYGKYDGLQLSSITHQPGSPWEQVWNSGGGKANLGVIIPNNIITEYYKQRANM